MTRVAGANPRIWVDIFLENRDGARRRRSPSTGAGSSRSRPRSPPATPASSRAGSARPPANRRRLLETAYDDAGDAAAAARPRARPAGRDRRDRAGARRRADQHRRLRPAAPLERARRHARDPRRRRGARPRARPRCSSSRATASSSRRCSRTSREDRARRACDRAAHVAVPGDKSISHRAVAARRGRDGETRISGFGRSERHRGDDRGGARARRHASTRPTSTRCASSAPACAA